MLGFVPHPNLRGLENRPPQKPKVTAKRCVNEHGVSLHAAMRCAANQPNQLEGLCPNFTCPAIANTEPESNFVFRLEYLLG